MSVTFNGGGQGGRIRHGFLPLQGLYTASAILIGGITAQSVFPGGVAVNGGKHQQTPSPVVARYFYLAGRTGSRWDAFIDLPAGVAVYDFGCSTSPLPDDYRVYVFGGRDSTGAASAKTVWIWDPFATLTDPDTSVTTNQPIQSYDGNNPRTNPVVVPFVFNNPGDLGGLYPDAKYAGFYVVGGEGALATSSDWYIVDPSGVNPDNVFGRTPFVHTNAFVPMQGAHLSGAGYVYPNRTGSLLFVGGQTGSALAPCVERVNVSDIQVPGTINFGVNPSRTKLLGTGTLTTMRHSFASAIVGGKLWVVGGIASTGGTYLSTTEIFDFTTEAWSAGPSLPQPVANGQLLVPSSSSDEVLLIGGDNGTSTTPNYHTRYLDAVPAWTTMAPLVIPRTNHRAIVVPPVIPAIAPILGFTFVQPGDVVVFGGDYLSGGVRVSPYMFAEEELSFHSATSPGFDPASRIIYNPGIGSPTFFADAIDIVGSTFNNSGRPSPRGPVMPPFSLTVSRACPSGSANTSSAEVGQPYEIMATGVLGSARYFSTGSIAPFVFRPAMTHFGGLNHLNQNYFASTVPPGISALDVIQGAEQINFYLPRGFVMNSSTITYRNIGGTIVTSTFVAKMNPSVTNMDPSSAPVALTTTLNWRGLWLDYAKAVNFQADASYEAGVQFPGVLLGTGAFSTTFRTPGPNDNVIGPSNTVYYLRPGTTHKIIGTYDVDIIGFKPVDFGFTWTTPAPVGINASSHFQDGNLLAEWILDDGAGAGSTSAIGSSYVAGGGPTTYNFDLGAGYLPTAQAASYRGFMRKLKASFSNGFAPSDSSRMANALLAAPLTVEFWIQHSNAAAGPIEFIWSYAVQTNQVAYTFPAVASTAQNTLLNVTVEPTSASPAATTKVSLRWEAGFRQNVAGTNKSPDICGITSPVLSILDGNRHHVAIVRTSFTAADFYVDGVLVGAGTAFVTHFSTSTGNNTVGQAPSGGSSDTIFFGGAGLEPLLGDFCVSNKARSAEEVRRFYLEGLGRAY